MKKFMLRVSVTGTSMYPALLPSDSVIVARSETYPLGSILVFSYKTEGYLIHRLLRVAKNRYYCKGDNSFRLEDVEKDQILGRVVLVKRIGQTFVPAEVDNKFIDMSLKIYREFVLSGYNHQKIEKSNLYIEYKNLYLNAR